MRFEDLYYDEITEASFLEMVEICRWLNEIYGHHPVIIGGWAVFLHHPAVGSRDIDIVFPNRKLKDIVVMNYLHSHGYQSEGVFGKEYFKEIPTSKRNERIIIDACSIEDVNRVRNSDIIIPWQLAFEHQVKKKVEGFDLYVPKVEVMLLFKAKAAIDRAVDMKQTFDPFYLQQKIVKDHNDLRNLFENCDVDKDLMTYLLDKYGFMKLFSDECRSIGIDAGL